ncbi:MAG: fumarate hydratase [Clostridiales bacterium]|nr:fumarate hydratase [Clostridiales bacterium]
MPQFTAEQLLEHIARLRERALVWLPPAAMMALETASEAEVDGAWLADLWQQAQRAAFTGTALAQDCGRTYAYVDAGPDIELDGAVAGAVVRRMSRNGLHLAVSPTMPDLLVETRIGEDTELADELLRALPAEKTGLPWVLGVGVGKTALRARLLAGRALLRSVDEPNPDAMLAWLEADALRRINGQTLTALAVNIEAEGGAECLAICLGRHPLMCAEERIA